MTQRTKTRVAADAQPAGFVSPAHPLTTEAPGRFLGRRLLLPLLAFSLATPAMAEDSEGDDKAELETMVVTAHRTPVALSDLGSSASVLDEAQITERQQIFAADLLRDLPGASLSRQSGNGSVTQLRVRGAESNHLLVVIDGVEVNDPSAGDEYDFGSLTNYDIANFELVRGPQSALWGSDAMAGILNITTRQTSEPVGGSVFLEGGSFGTISGGGRIGVSNDRGSLTLSGSRYETDGVSAAACQSPIGAEPCIEATEKDGYENTTVGLNGRYRFSDLFRLGFSTRYVDDTIEFDGTEAGIPVDADNVTDKEQLQLSVDAGLTLFDGRWDNTLRYTYLDTERDTVSDFPTLFGAEKDGVYFQSTVFAGRGPRIDRHRLTLAVDYEDESYTQRSDFADQDQTLDNLGVAFEYYGQPVDGLNISGSVRYDDNSVFEDITTYRLTGSYAIAGIGTRLKASTGTGQKRPTFTERFGFNPDSFIGNPDLTPEKNEGYDVGIEQTLLSGRARLGATYFNERLEDEIVTEFLPGFVSTSVNLDGKSRREGVEVEWFSALSSDLTLRANYTYTDSKQPDATGEGDVREIRRPRHQAAINLNQVFYEGRGNINFNVSYTGAQTDTLFTFPAQTVELEAYTLVNITGELDVTDWLTLFFRAENLFEQRQIDVAGFRQPGQAFYGGFRIGTGR